MTSGVFAFVFLLALALSVATRLWLAQRQVRHVTANRATVPLHFAGRVPLAADQKAADYTVARVRVGMADLALETIVLSIVALGIVDSITMLPLAISALAASGPVFRAPLTVVVLFCVGCLGVLLAGHRLVRLPLVGRSRRATAICRRIGENIVVTRSMLVAGVLLFACWTSRTLGSVFLLLALGGGFSPTLALVILCMAGATSILPITAGGAVAGMGATAGVLFALGASRDVALNFPLASGLLLTVAALTAAAAGFAGSLASGLRGRLVFPGGLARVGG